MSYQPEERYWTDYLRIALPVVGLLLMLGLFWYWASAVIGNDSNENPADRPTQVVALVTQPAPTATNTPEVNISAETVTPEPTKDSGDNADATEEPTQEPDGQADETPEALGKGFEVGANVITNTSDVNLRADPSKDASIVDTLPESTILTVTLTGEEADGYVWIGVKTAGGQEGFVADDFVDLADE